MDSNHTFSISVPDKIPMIDDESCGITASSNQSLEQPTCGWLIEQVQIKYA